MRELTNAEIEQFDFTGQVPDLHVHGHRGTASAKTAQITNQFAAQSKKRGFRLGAAHTA